MSPPPRYAQHSDDGVARSVRVATLRCRGLGLGGAAGKGRNLCCRGLGLVHRGLGRNERGLDLDFEDSSSGGVKTRLPCQGVGLLLCVRYARPELATPAASAARISTSQVTSLRNRGVDFAARSGTIRESRTVDVKITLRRGYAVFDTSTRCSRLDVIVVTKYGPDRSRVAALFSESSVSKEELHSQRSIEEESARVSTRIRGRKTIV